MKYDTVHKRLCRLYGAARTHPCGGCGKPAREWAYDHTDTHEMTGPDGHGKILAYSLDPSRYLPLCRWCHRALDVPAAACGTISGYDRHRRLGEQPCGPCREAKAAAGRAYLADPAVREAKRVGDRAYQRARRADPAHREAKNARNRAYRARKKEGR